MLAVSFDLMLCKTALVVNVIGIYEILHCESHPIMARMSARIQFLGKVSQVVIIMEVKERNQLLRKTTTNTVCSYTVSVSQYCQWGVCKNMCVPDRSARLVHCYPHDQSVGTSTSLP